MSWTSALPDFSFVTQAQSPLVSVWEKLWPKDQQGKRCPANDHQEDLDVGVLSRFIDTWTADENALRLGAPATGSLVNDPDEDQFLMMEGEFEVPAMDEKSSDMDDEEEGEQIRYIDLERHTALLVKGLDSSDKLIFRQEYEEFIAHRDESETEEIGGSRVKSRAIPARTFFLTGHPGVGKSVGASCVLLLLLASRREVFFIEEESRVTYFSASGVQLSTNRDAPMMASTVSSAVNRSWVLVDVEAAPERWLPRQWTKSCFTTVWTSSPLAKRQHHFNKRFKAQTWHMKPWSTVEIAAMTYLNHYDPEMIRERYMAVGPVAGTLFDPSHPIVPITSIILGAFKIGILSFITMQPEWVSHQMFILRPRSQRERHLPSYEFLSHSVVQQTTQLGRYFDAVRAELFDAFEVPETRSAASKLVECVLHGALMGGPLPADKKIDLPESLGGDKVVATLELVGKAQDFVLEADAEGKRDMRPLYLRPQASVDAIIVTDTAVALVQSSVVEPHSHVIKTLLQILSRLSSSGFKEAVRELPLVYCIVGMDKACVRGRMQQAHNKLMALKALSSKGLAKELRIRTIIAQKLEVRGYTLHLRDGLTEVTLAT